MNDCPVCLQISEKKNLLYEDEKIIAFLSDTPASAGHIIVAPRQHAPIFEQIPDFVVSELFVKANKLSIACFEVLGAEGTNIIIQNGVAAGQNCAHTCLNVVSRKNDDGLNLLWKPKQLSEEQMSVLELKIKDETKKIGVFEKEKPKLVEIKKPEEIKISKEENYLIRQLKRIP